MSRQGAWEWFALRNKQQGYDLSVENLKTIIKISESKSPIYYHQALGQF